MAIANLNIVVSQIREAQGKREDGEFADLGSDHIITFLKFLVLYV